MQFNKDPEFLKKRAEAYKTKRDNPNSTDGDFLFKQKLPFYVVKDGENIIRLLPAMWDQATFPWVEAYIHYQIGANNGQFFCLAKMASQPCPICEEAKAATDRGEKPEVVRTLYPQHRAIAWIVDRLDPGKGPQIWTMPYKNIAHQIITISFKRSTGEPVFVDDPTDGWDILFMKEGKGMLTKYSGVRKDDEPTPLHVDPETAAKWLQEAETKCLKEQLNYKSYEHIKSVLFGIPEEPTQGEAVPLPTVQESGAAPAASVSTAPEQAPVATAPVTAPAGEITKAMLKTMDLQAMVALIEQRSLSVDPSAWNSDELPEVIALEMNLTD